MKTLKKVPLQLVLVENFPDKEHMEFGKIYYSETFQMTNHLCVCGCGYEVPLPISNTEWQINLSNGKVSLTPSILQRFECKTHYVITNGVANII